jgi:hypothetical protein
MPRPPAPLLLSLALAIAAPAAVFGATLNCAPATDCPIQYYGNTAAGVGGNFLAGEVFAPAFSGKLESMRFALSSAGEGDVTCQVRTCSGGMPTSTVLAEVVIPGSPYQQTPYDADFSATNVVLQGGTAYAFTLKAVGSSVVEVYGLFGPCSGGSQRYVYSNDGGATWGSATDHTLFYSVCLDPFVTPVRSTAWGTLKSRYR